MPTPVRWRNLVFDQCVDGFCIRHSEKRLGQAHQRNALVGGKAVFSQKHFHQTGLGVVADRANEVGGIGRNAGAVLSAQSRLRAQCFDTSGLIGIGVFVDGDAQVYFSNF